MSLSDLIASKYPDGPLGITIGQIKKSFPDFAIERKRDSALCKFVALVAYVFNPKFMSQGTFAFRNTVYVSPDTEIQLDTDRGRKLYTSTLAHEFVHMLDQRHDGTLAFLLKYTFPQNLAVLSLLAVLAVWWLPALGFLGFLGFLFPWQAQARLRYEIRGYSVGHALFLELFGQQHRESSLDHADKSLRSGAYYYMTKKSHRQELNAYSMPGPLYHHHPEVRGLHWCLEDGGHYVPFAFR